MKRSIIFALTILLVSSTIWLLSGCGSNPTGGGGSNPGSSANNSVSPNNGTISGYAYRYNQSTGTCTGISGIIVTVSTEAMTQESSVATDSSGYYFLTGLPSGEIAVTATSEIPGFLDATTVVMNSDKFNFYMDAIRDAGTATISGTVDGIGSSWGSSLYLDSATASGNLYQYSSTYYSGTHTYEAHGLPENDTVYIDIENGPPFVCAYNKIVSNGNSPYTMDVSFEPFVTIEASCVNVPNDYSLYWLDADVFYNYTDLFWACNEYSSTNAKNGQAYNICKLKPGDSYGVDVEMVNSNDVYIDKMFYGCNAGATTFDMSMPSVSGKLISCPSAEANITGLPTIEWNAVPDTDYYQVTFNDLASFGFYWTGYTHETQIGLPAYLIDKLVSGHQYSVSVYAYKWMSTPPIYDFNNNLLWTEACPFEYSVSGGFHVTWH